MNKTCTDCKTEQPLENFNRKGKWYQFRCRSCSKVYMRKHYEDNRAKYRQRNVDRIERWREIAREGKNVPCTDCGHTYPHYVMQYDHIGSDKVFNIADVQKVSSEKALRAEMAKCEVVCANCHAARTWFRLHDGR